MRSAGPLSRRALVRHLLSSLFAVGLIAGAAPAWATDPALVITRVEEDWELVVAEPDIYSDAPQVTSVLSPFGHLESVYAAFEFNHRSQPQFTAGGVQVQVWNGEEPLANRPSEFTNKLQFSGETVRWTQVMELNGGQLHFEIANGSSTSWGEFGTGHSLRVSVASSLSTLSGYSSSVSVDSSGVGYAGNRVTSVTLKRVRRYLVNNDLLDEVTSPVVVHTNQ